MLMSLTLAGFTASGNLASFASNIKNKTKRLPRAEQEVGPSSSTPSTRSIQMMEIWISGRVPKEKLDNQLRVTQATQPSISAQDVELAKRKAVELFKVRLSLPHRTELFASYTRLRANYGRSCFH